MIECPIKSMVLSGGDFTTQAVTGSVWNHRGHGVTCLAEDCQTCVGYRTLFVMDKLCSPAVSGAAETRDLTLETVKHDACHRRQPALGQLESLAFSLQKACE